MSAHVKCSSVVGKLRKAGFDVNEWRPGSFLATRPDSPYRITWFRNGEGDSACCLNVAHKNDHDDMQSDYSAGSWCDSIAQAIRFATT